MEVENLSYNQVFRVPYRYYDKVDGTLLTATQALKNARYRLVPTDDGNGYRTTELLVCDRPKFNPEHYGLLGEGSRRRPAVIDEDDELLPPDVLKDYMERSRRRARKAVKDIMDCNRFDWFVTFTLDQKKIDRQSYTDFVKAVNNYMKNRVQRYGWRYLAVPEYHQDGESLHLHAVVSGDKINLVYSGTVIRPDKRYGRKPVTEATAKKQGYKLSECKPVYNVTDWPYGFSTAIRTYGDREALRRYVGKYITKSEHKIGGRWYYSGGELARPLYVCCNIPFSSVEGDIEFSNDGGAFKIKYNDRGDDNARL